MNRIFRNLLILVVLGLAAALPVLMARMQIEQDNSSAEILFDYSALSDYARRSGTSLDVLLKRCRENGVTAIAVEENSRDSLAGRGLARVASYFDMQDLQAQKRVDSSIKLDPLCAYYVAQDSTVARSIEEGAKYSLGSGRARVVPPGGNVVELRCDIRDLPALGLGMPYDIIDNLNKEYGFRVWLRPWNSPEIGEAEIRSLIGRYGQLASQHKVEGLIFGGLRNEVYGYPNNLELTAQALRETPLKLGVIELAPKAQQKGIISLAKLCKDRVVRVMAVSPAHQAKLDPQAVVSMYSLGVRERGIRLVYCRFYNDGVERLSASEANAAFLSGLNGSLANSFHAEASTYAKGDSIVRTGFTMWSLAIIIISVSITSCLCMLFHMLRCYPYKSIHVLVPLVALLTAFCCFTGIGCRWERLLLALGAVTVFPVFAYVLLTPIWERAERDRSFIHVLGDGLVVLGVGVTLSLYSGLLAAALLSDLNYMLSLEVFRGVKLHSMAVPALIFLIWLLQQHRRGGLKGLLHFLEADVKIWHVVVFVIFAAVGGFYLIRTGNSGGDLVVSETERAFRRWLDGSLGVRPRFKEFLLGNPALVLLPVLMFLRWRAGVPLAVIAGGVGMASIAGTYCHIHTPVLVSLHRTVNGVVLGGVGGLGLGLLFFALKSLLVPYTSKLELRYVEADDKDRYSEVSPVKSEDSSERSKQLIQAEVEARNSELFGVATKSSETKRSGSRRKKKGPGR